MIVGFQLGLVVEWEDGPVNEKSKLIKSSFVSWGYTHSFGSETVFVGDPKKRRFGLNEREINGGKDATHHVTSMSSPSGLVYEYFPVFTCE